MKKVFICSPYRPAGISAEEKRRSLDRNISIACAACRLAESRGYLPLAPHLYFPQFLDDETPEEREMGMLLGLEWLSQSDEVWVVGNIITVGMEREIREAWKKGIPIRKAGFSNHHERR